MKKTLILTSIAFAFLFQSCGHKCQQEHHSKQRVKTMLINSSGVVTIEPDEASITIILRCLDMNIEKSKSCIIEESDKLNEMLKGFGIIEKDIQTTSINLSKEYKREYKNRDYTSIFEGYEASVNTRVTIKELTVLEDLYTKLLTNDKASYGRLYYTHTKIDSLNNVAYQSALANANTTADQLLVKMDESEKEILRIGNSGLPSVRYENSFVHDLNPDIRYDKNKNSLSTISINHGMISISKNLVVEYSIR